LGFAEAKAQANAGATPRSAVGAGTSAGWADDARTRSSVEDTPPGPAPARRESSSELDGRMVQKQLHFSASGNENSLRQLFDGNEAAAQASAAAMLDSAGAGMPHTAHSHDSKDTAPTSGSTPASDSPFRTALNIGNMTAIKLIINAEPKIVHELFEVCMLRLPLTRVGHCVVSCACLGC